MKPAGDFPSPYGATKRPEGINFALFSKHAVQVSLCIFSAEDPTPLCEIPLDPEINKTGNVWHILVHSIPSHYHYGYRVAGPYNPLKGHYFDNRMILLDPYAKQVATPATWGSGKRKDTSHVHKGIIYPMEPFNWESDAHPKISHRELIIYEMHVRGFTQDPSSGAKNRGTFLGVIEKILI